MKIIAINGSHRPDRCTAELLGIVLQEAAALGAHTESFELSQLDIGYCSACNACLAASRCTLSDDMDGIVAAMLEADGIVLGSPDYFSNVTARMKTFMDRTRFLHMKENLLKDKVGGIVSVAGLANCGVESTVEVMDRFFATHEMLVVHPRPEGPVIGSAVTGSLMEGFRDDGRVQWRRSVQEDLIALRFASQLGRDMVALIQKLSVRNDAR